MRLRRFVALTATTMAVALGTSVGLVIPGSAAAPGDPADAGSDGTITVRTPEAPPLRETVGARTTSSRVDDTRRTIVGPASNATLNSNSTRAIEAPTFKVLVIPVYFSASAGGNATTAGARSLLASASSWYSDVSGGKVTVEPTVTSPLRVDNVCAGETDDDAVTLLTSQAKQAAAERGITPDSFAATMIMHPDCGFVWEGIANWTIVNGVSEHTVLIDGPDGRAKNVVIHELGHTLRLDHANLLTCWNGSRFQTAYLNSSSSCDSMEYADPYDMMGNDPDAGAFSGANLSALGWLPGADLVTRTSGSVKTRLTPLATGNGVRVIKVRASARVTYWIEYRRRSGVDAAIPAEGVGVQVRRTVKTAENNETDEYLPQTDYVDMAPETDPLDTLRSGSNWTSREGVRISVGTQSSSAVWVRVRFNAPKPKKPSAPSLRLAPGTRSMTARWDAPADRGRPVSSYRLYLYDASGRRVLTRDLDGRAALAERAAVFSGLSAGRRYTVKIKAINDVGFSATDTASAKAR